MSDGCPHVVIEIGHRDGECELGEDCPLSDLRESDYDAYRNGHRNVVPKWVVEPD